jgi:enoyl-CoA hydratase
VNRVLADDDLAEEGMKLARRLADGPTIAHAGTKRIVRAQLQGGVRAADEITAGIFADLFETEDLQNAVRTFLDEGPGNATFAGR